MAELFPLTGRRKTQVRVLPRFPARVEGGAGIDVARSAGVYTFALKFSNLTPIASLADDDLFVVERADGSFAKIANSNMAAGGGASAFTDLTDVPSAYTGEALKVLRVNAGETGIEFASAGGLGDMLAATYDPQEIEADAFDRANHTGTQDLSTISDAGTMAAETATDYYTSAEVDSGFQPLAANLTEWAGINPSANGGSLVAAADYAAMRTLLDLEAGTDFLSPGAIAAAYQPLDADLTALAAANNSTVLAATTASFLTADETKLDGIEALADVTDAANVAAAGAIMSSLLTTRGDIPYRNATVPARLPLGTANQVLGSDGTDPVWRSQANFFNFGYRTGHYYYHGRMAGATVVVSANLLYAYPIVVYRPVTLAAVCLTVTTGAAGNVRMGIYTNNNGYPDARVVDAGTADTTSNATKEIATSQVLQPGQYWMAAVFDATPTCRRNAGTTTPLFALPVGSTAADTNDAANDTYVGYSVAQAYGALPSTYPGAGTLLAQGSAPRMGIKI